MVTLSRESEAGGQDWSCEPLEKYKETKGSASLSQCAVITLWFVVIRAEGISTVRHGP